MNTCHFGVVTVGRGAERGGGGCCSCRWSLRPESGDEPGVLSFSSGESKEVAPKSGKSLKKN
ncbi:hypothetical protein DY000_02034147 [Brassica cretica]|uniref:Uncharacterized protein n=1 Tax=Brassica cretica TaxID=69181 RepID=A0ABQ7DM86_BRACR|nr:hypothetical protein DY000_02034147 [Brassica cretica]